MFTNPVSNAAQAGFALTHALLFRYSETNKTEKGKYILNMYRLIIDIECPCPYKEKEKEKIYK